MIARFNTREELGMPSSVRWNKTVFSSSLKLDQIEECETILLRTAFIHRSENQNALFLEMQSCC